MKTIIQIVGGLLIFLITSSSYPPRYTYYLYDTYKNADFDYGKIISIDSFDGGKESRLNVFRPTKGKYTIYRYMSSDYGWIFDEVFDSINYMLMVKVDSDSIIEESFLYWLQNPNSPSSLYLLESSKHIKMKDTLTIKDFEFKTYMNFCGCELEEDFMWRTKTLGEAYFHRKE